MNDTCPQCRTGALIGESLERSRVVARAWSCGHAWRADADAVPERRGLLRRIPAVLWSGQVEVALRRP